MRPAVRYLSQWFHSLGDWELSSRTTRKWLLPPRRPATATEKGTEISIDGGCFHGTETG